MGRQIRFYQTQEDVVAMLDAFYPDGVVLYDHQANLIEDYRSVDFHRYFKPNSTDVVGAYFVAYRTTVFDKGLARRYKYPPFDRQIIEYCPPKSSWERADHINEGRFYLANELYQNEEMVALYQRLVKYIRKHYRYSKGMYAYVSPDFQEAMQQGRFIPCNADNPCPREIW